MRADTLAFTTFLGLAAASSAQTRPAVEFDRFSLPSGIRVVYVHVSDATRQTVFTFLPLSLATDDKDRAQWSHLLEHMLIRSTDPESPNPPGMALNGETTHAYLRMESIVEPDKWLQSLERHAKWLTARQFDAVVLEREKLNIAAEEQATAANGATSKFALAAWNQIVNHGATHAAVHGDVATANLEQLHSYAKVRVPIDDSVLIASIGPAHLDDFKREVDRLFGTLAATPRTDPAQPKDRQPAGSIHATWDLPTRHAIWWWTLPDNSTGTLASASCLARSLHLRLMAANVDKSLFRNVHVYPFVSTPAGLVLIVDCCLPQDIQTTDDATAAMAKVWTVVRSQLDEMIQTSPKYVPVVFSGDMLVGEMNLAPRFARMRTNLPQARHQLEAQWLLVAMNQEYPWNLSAEKVAMALWRVDLVALKAVIDQVTGNPQGTLLLSPKLGRQPALEAKQ